MKLDFLKEYDFFTGVPDSRLKPLCNYLMSSYGIGKHHIIAANEGNCVAIAAGYHLSTGKVPIVYMQNSGIGNIINPVASLMNDKVYGIPCIFFVGWRGEPGMHDEPQHAYQGGVTVRLLEDMNIRTFVIGKETTEEEVMSKLAEWSPLLEAGKQVAFIVKTGALEFDGIVKYSNAYEMTRECVIRSIVAISDTDPVVSTTGKISRELFEIREANKQGHGYDFLTVGSMGHSSSIAFGIALQKPGRKVWCLDGDGAFLMHMGAAALIGANCPRNMVHVVINNGAHETVGGMPTVATKIDIVAIAKGCGYPRAVCVECYGELEKELFAAKKGEELSLIEVRCSVGSRDDLGRPTTEPKENKRDFMALIE